MYINSAWLVSITDKLLPELFTLNFYRIIPTQSRMLVLFSRFQPSRKLNCGPQLRFKGIRSALVASSECFARVNVSFSCGPLCFSKNPLGFLNFFPTFTFFFFTLFTACCSLKVQLGSFRKRWCDQAGILCSGLVTTLQGPTKPEETQWWRRIVIKEMRERGSLKDKPWRLQQFSLQR